MRLIDQLAELQGFDRTLDEDRRRYTEIQEALHEPEVLRAARLTKDEALNREQEWRRQRGQRETMASEQAAKIKVQEDMLYSGRVKDAREQVAMAQNIEALKRRLQSLEEEALAAMMELEQAEQELIVRGDALAEEEQRWRQEQARLQKERDALVAHARQTKAQRDALAGRLPTPTLQRYEALRQKRGSMVVSPFRVKFAAAAAPQCPLPCVSKCTDPILLPVPSVADC